MGIKEKYIGFAPEVRITHNLHMVSFITITLSGFYISNPIAVLGIKGVKWIGFVHTVSAIVLYATFIFRLYYAFGTGNYINFKFLKEDIPLTLEWIKYYFFIRKEAPPQRKYNPLQKLTYYTLITLLVVQGLTGAALFGLESFGFVLAILKGRQVVRTLHFFIAVALASIIALHIYLVFTATDQRMRKAMFALGPVRERED